MPSACDRNRHVAADNFGTALLSCCCVDCCGMLQRVDSQCRGHWAAASNQARRRDKQEITGRFFMTDARHGIPVAALNQIRTGERYSYALTLGMAAAAQQAGLRQLHIDIMCKWAPWLRRVHTKAQQLRSSGQMQSQSTDVQQLPDRLAALNTLGRGLSGARLVHSAAHGSLHAQACQVRVVSIRRVPNLISCGSVKAYRVKCGMPRGWVAARRDRMKGTSE